MEPGPPEGTGLIEPAVRDHSRRKKHVHPEGRCELRSYPRGLSFDGFHGVASEPLAALKLDHCGVIRVEMGTRELERRMHLFCMIARQLGQEHLMRDVHGNGM